MSATDVRTWSVEQDAIYGWFETSQQVLEHLVVVAFAGCGKTTTIVEGVNRAPETAILVCAYNKKIAEELVARVTNPNVTVKTLHAVGYAAVRRFRERIKCDFGSERADKLTDAVCGRTAPDAIKKLVSKLHTKGREIAPHATQLGELTNIAINFECVPDDAWQATSFNFEYVELKALEAMQLASDVKSGDTIDGSDMIFLPVRNSWLTKSYDLVVVDEAQDMTTAQLEIAQGVCSGRICVVGDPNQAIYGFRGADSESINRLKSELNATELGLTTTYRCGRQIVALAQQFVPDFTAGPNNADGEVLDLAYDKLNATAMASDFILSRVNAPLVSIAMTLLRSGKRARVAGRDIGAGLKALVRKFRARSVPELLAKIASWEKKETGRLEAMLSKASNGRAKTIQAKIEGIKDQADMLVSLTDGSASVADVETRIDALFTDDGLGDAGLITCSSVHKAKGLEANRVFILSDTLRNHNQEERNIQYVAITRAKQTLVMVK
jgi:superfamily I DNA/RNA helicase